MWETKMQVINQQTKEPLWVEGMRVKAFTKEKAQDLLDRYDYNYLVLGDELIADIPCKIGTQEPDWDRRIDYDVIISN